MVIGIVFAYFSESFFREQIQDIFRWTTNNKIKFGGKNFYLFGSDFLKVSFGICFAIFAYANSINSLKKILFNGIKLILIFGILVILISAINANLKVIECTACDDGILSLHWNKVEYGLILGTSALLAIVPSVISIFRKRNQNI